MAKKEKQVEVKFGKNTFTISEEASKRLMQDLIEETKPRKPIKRVEKFSEKEQEQLMKLLKQAKPLFTKAVEAFDAAGDLDFDRMTREDEKWLESYMGRMGQVFDYVNTNLDAAFY